MTDFIKSPQSLDVLHKEAQSWTSDNMEVTVAASYDSDDPVTINLTSTLGHNKRVSAAKCKKNSNDVHWLPSSLSVSGDNAEFLRTTLVPIFAIACRNAGFVVSSKGWEKSLQCIRFCCQRGRKYECHPRSGSDHNQLAASANKGFYTSRPTKEETNCPFPCRACWSSKCKWWFLLPKLQGGNKCHCGHIQKTPDEARVLAHSSGSENTKLSQDCSQEHIVSSTAASLTHWQPGIDLEKHQTKCSNKKNLEEERKAAQEFVVGDAWR